MKLAIIITLAVGLIPQNLTDFTEGANELLDKQVENGLIDYQAIASNPQQINQLYEQLGSVSLEGATDAEKKAFYTNAYNILTIYQIIQQYPVKSPMDIAGFFDQKRHRVAGESLTLDELEKERLLKNHFDPRLHFVLVCAAMSCPPIADYAYQADRLDAQLEEKTRQTLNDPDFIRVKKEQKKVLVSKIFDWYQDDFTKNHSSILAYINQYRDEKIPSSYQVDFYEYDWSLNDR